MSGKKSQHPVLDALARLSDAAIALNHVSAHVIGADLTEADAAQLQERLEALATQLETLRRRCSE